MDEQRSISGVALALLAVVGALTAGYHALQLLGVVPIPALQGEGDFGLLGLLGAITWGALALFYLVTAIMVWGTDPKGWIVMAVLAVANLVIAILLIVLALPLEAQLPSLITNALILIVCFLPSTRRTFGMS